MTAGRFLCGPLRLSFCTQPHSLAKNTTMKTQFHSYFLCSAAITITAIAAPASAQQFDLRGMDSIQTAGPQSYSSGTKGSSGNRTRPTRQGVIADRSLHDYRFDTKTQTPGGSWQAALNPARWTVLGGIFGYEDGGMGPNRDGNWTQPYTPVQAPPTNPAPSPGTNPSDPQGEGGSEGEGQPQLLHDGTPYEGQMTISDCGGYIGYVPNDFQGSMEDWWHSPYCAYQITAARPTNIHYRSWTDQGSPTLF